MANHQAGSSAACSLKLARFFYSSPSITPTRVAHVYLATLPIHIYFPKAQPLSSQIHVYDYAASQLLFCFPSVLFRSPVLIDIDTE